ncbi:hypothetical protein [Cryobacterium sp. Y50]|uniref:hypothetical protein n=1 Tax=Cryobacterium sp. Y50 TaxID=2048286 RepID=UPI0011B08936|nr:hypothetical protein [Cryobacterium sp. Y50]
MIKTQGMAPHRADMPGGEHFYGHDDCADASMPIDYFVWKLAGERAGQQPSFTETCTPRFACYNTKPWRDSKVAAIDDRNVIETKLRLPVKTPPCRVFAHRIRAGCTWRAR